MRNYARLNDSRHAIKGGQIKMFNLERGYYFKKKEQKRDGHALRCKKYARFADAETGTFWGLPLDKPWFMCDYYGGDRMTKNRPVCKMLIYTSQFGDYKRYPLNPENRWFRLQQTPYDLVGSTLVEVRTLGSKWVYWRNKTTTSHFKKLSRTAWDRLVGKEEVPEQERWNRYNSIFDKWQKEERSKK